MIQAKKQCFLKNKERKGIGCKEAMLKT